MATTLLNKRNLDIYMSFLNGLDKKSKKILISKLNESLEFREQKNIGINELFGAWKGNKISEDIIVEIRNSNINKVDIVEL